MSRRHSSKQDSLELLLDTICNTFGGVLFIAILVVMLLQQTGDGTDNQSSAAPPVTELDMQSLMGRLEAANSELATMRENRSSQEAVVASFAPADVRELISQRRDAAVRQDDLQAEVDRLHSETAKIVLQIDAMEERDLQVRSSLAEAVDRKAKMQETLEKDRQSRVQEVRMPVLRSEEGKREIGLVLRFGRLYVWHRYGADGERLGLNTDDFVVVSDDGNSLVTRPIPTRGTPLDDSPSSREAVRGVLRRFDPRRCYLTPIVRPDSYGVFKHLRDEAISLGFEYRLMPQESDSPVADRGGVGGKVQ